MFTQFLHDFLPVWNLFSEHSLPPVLQRFSGDFEPGEIPPLARSYTPVVGFAAGLIGAALLWFVSSFFNTVPLLVLTGIAIALLFEYFTRGRDLSAFSLFLSMRITGMDSAHALSAGPSDASPSDSPVGMLTIVFSVLIRAALFAALAVWHLGFWIPAVFTGAYLIRSIIGGAVLTCEQPGWERAHLYFGGITILLWGALTWHLSGMVVLLIAVWAICSYVNSKLGARLPGGFFPVNAFGYASEILLLLLGILLYVR